MNNLRRNFERFCYQNRSKGIPNLMLYICVGNAIVYLISFATGDLTLYSLLCFHSGAIFAGQLWRLLTYPLTMYQSNMLLMLISLVCYFSLGRAIEQQWGTLKFNLFYLTGVLLTDIYALIFGCQASVYQLNTSLFLTFATLYPQASFLLFFIIPIKAWVFALFNLIIILTGVLLPPYGFANFLPLIALANYFLFMGKDVVNVIPLTWRAKLRSNAQAAHRSADSGPKVIHFHTDTQKANYTHRCTVCGRTDVSNPELEFRYCSRCKGYYCYCQDHISNHAHIQ